MKKLLLISNRVMHYRVSVYNYFYRRFKESGVEFIVRSNKMQEETPYPLAFDFKEIAFTFSNYKTEIETIQPDAVILFLHLRDKIYLPLIHWLKLKKIPIIYWNKAINYDDPESRFKKCIFNYLHTLSDGIILYAEHEKEHIKEKNRHKVHIAPNTVNFDDFPEISATKEQLKQELGIPFDKVVLSVGRMGSAGGRKKIDHLITIFNELDNRSYGLVIVGSGMTDTVLKKNNRTNIMCLGEIHDPHNTQISKVFKMADVFSIPGHVGLGLNQAFYWGLPVVTEEGGQPPEIHYLENGRNGFIVPDNDLDELRKKILYLLENDIIRHEYAKNAKVDILSKASISHMFSGFKNCFESLPHYKH